MTRVPISKQSSAGALLRKLGSVAVSFVSNRRASSHFRCHPAVIFHEDLACRFYALAQFHGFVARLRSRTPTTRLPQVSASFLACECLFRWRREIPFHETAQPLFF